MKILSIIVLLFLISCENKLEPISQSVNEDEKIIESVSFNKSQVLEINQPAPIFYLNPNTDLEKSLRDFRGKVVMLQFEASWCSFCKVVAPKVAKIASEIGEEDYVIIKIFDSYYNRDSFIEAANQYEGPYYRVWNNLSEGFNLFDLYNVNSIPRSIILDKDGIVRENRSTNSDSFDIKEVLESYNN